MPTEDGTFPLLATQLDTLNARLVESIGRWTAGHQDCATAVPSLFLFRRDTPTQPSSCRVEASAVFVVQGAKQLFVGDHVYGYDTRRFLINSLDIPARSQALQAGPDKPCLGLVLKLDLHIMAELIAQSALSPPRDRVAAGSSALGTITPDLLEPFVRLIGLLDEPASIPVLAPLIKREIHYRLLMSDQAARLWQIASVGSLSQRIARAIDWLRANYTQPLRIDELADHVQMSTSSLHHHFRQLTAMSPLQYQKWQRLHEARRLMLNERLDAAGAAFKVGYESPSQFSREYSRLFGAPPKRDIENLRHHADSANGLERLQAGNRGLLANSEVV